MENKNEILEENALGKTLGAAALATSMAFGGGQHNAQPPKKPATVQYQRCHAKNVWANPEYNKKVEKYLNEYLAQYPNNYWKALTLAEDRARNEVACGMTYKLKENPTAKGKPMHETSNILMKQALQEGYQALFGEECPESLCEGLDDSPVLESGLKDIGIGLAGMGIVGGIGGAAMLGNDAHQAHLANEKMAHNQSCGYQLSPEDNQKGESYYSNVELEKLLTRGYQLSQEFANSNLLLAKGAAAELRKDIENVHNSGNSPDAIKKLGADIHKSFRLRKSLETGVCKDGNRA